MSAVHLRFRFVLSLYILGKVALPLYAQDSAQSWNRTKDCPAILCPAAIESLHPPSFPPSRDSNPLWSQTAQDQSNDTGPTLSPATQAPSLESFPKQLLANFKGLFSSNNLKPLIVGSAATGVSAVFDDEVKDHFSPVRRFKELGEVGYFLGNSVTLGAVSAGILFSSRLSESARFRSMGFALAQGYVVNLGTTAALKTASHRERPNGENQRSFPSGHTSAAFTAATVISEYYPKTLIPAYVMASLVGASRIEKNKHFLSDVVAGATLGYIVGRTVVRGTNAATNTRKISVTPMFLEQGGGVTLQVTW